MTSVTLPVHAFRRHQQEEARLLAIIKAVVVLGGIAASAFAAQDTPPDALATRVVLYAAAGAGLIWFFRNVLRPVAKVLHRMAQAVEALEDLPAWRQRTDRRIDRTNRRIRHMELGMGQMASGVTAILRELGIESAVRQQFTDPAEFERWLEVDAALEDDEAADEEARHPAPRRVDQQDT